VTDDMEVRKASCSAMRGNEGGNVTVDFSVTQTDVMTLLTAVAPRACRVFTAVKWSLQPQLRASSFELLSQDFIRFSGPEVFIGLLAGFRTINGNAVWTTSNAARPNTGCFYLSYCRWRRLLFMYAAF